MKRLKKIWSLSTLIIFLWPFLIGSAHRHPGQDLLRAVHSRDHQKENQSPTFQARCLICSLTLTTHNFNTPPIIQYAEYYFGIYLNIYTSNYYGSKTLISIDLRAPPDNSLS